MRRFTLPLLLASSFLVPTFALAQVQTGTIVSGEVQGTSTNPVDSTRTVDWGTYTAHASCAAPNVVDPTTLLCSSLSGTSGTTLPTPIETTSTSSTGGGPVDYSNLIQQAAQDAAAMLTQWEQDYYNSQYYASVTSFLNNDASIQNTVAGVANVSAQETNVAGANQVNAATQDAAVATADYNVYEADLAAGSPYTSIAYAALQGANAANANALQNASFYGNNANDDTLQVGASQSQAVKDAAAAVTSTQTAQAASVAAGNDMSQITSDLAREMGYAQASGSATLLATVQSQEAEFQGIVQSLVQKINANVSTTAQAWISADSQWSADMTQWYAYREVQDYTSDASISAKNAQATALSNVGTAFGFLAATQTLDKTAAQSAEDAYNNEVASSTGSYTSNVTTYNSAVGSFTTNLNTYNAAIEAGASTATLTSDYNQVIASAAQVNASAGAVSGQTVSTSVIPKP